MSDGITAASSLLMAQSILGSNNTQVDKLANEMSSGQKGTGIADYGSQGAQLLDLQSQTALQQAYVSNNTQISTYLSAYDTTLAQLKTDATQLQTSLGAFNASDPSTLASLTALASGTAVDVGATLNTEVGNRYLYAGTRYGTAPVNLNQLTPLAAPAAFTAVTSASVPSNLPAYDTQAPNDPTGEAYAQQKVQIGDNENLTYGFTSNDPAFQQLVYAIQNIQAGAASGNSAQQAQYFANANGALSNVLTGIESMQQTNSQNEAMVSNATNLQKQTITSLQTQTSGITGIDSAQVATQLSAIENQLNGSYKVTSTLLNLSLLNYLPATLG